MAKDVRIIPADGDIQFYNAAASASGKIQQVNDDLVLSNAVGDILFGDTNSDVYIGDGVSNVDIIFEQDGEIRGEAGSNVTLTLGSKDTTIYVTGSTVALQKDGGNVGIGTTSPVKDLQIGAGTFSYASQRGIGIAATQNPGISIRDTDSNVEWDVEVGSSSAKMGMQSNHDLYLITNNTTKATIKAAGNVGIGTTVPSEKLEVRDGNIILSGSTPRVMFDNPALTYQHDWFLRNDGGTGQMEYRFGGGAKVYFNNHSIRFGDWDAGTGTNAASYDPRIQKRGLGQLAGGLDFYTNNQPRISISGSNGNVGIGTVTPDFKLDVAGDIGMDGNLYHNGDHNTYIGFTADTQTFRTGGTDRLVINNTSAAFTNDVTVGGNLTVAGIVTAQEFHTEFVSASIIFKSGSTQFGDDSNDTHIFSGSLTQYTSATRYINLRGGSGDLQVVSDNNTAPVAYIKGTGTADLLNVFDNTTEVFTILDGGNVGINTNSPGSRLHVVGNGYFASDNTSGSLVVTRNSNQDQKLYLRGGAGSGEAWVAAQYQLELRSGLGGNTMYDVLLSTATGEALRVDAGNSNNIGIGTPSPTAKLHVEGTTRFGNSQSHLHQMTGSMLHFYNPSVSNSATTDLLKLQAYTGDFGVDPAAIALAFKFQDSNNSTNEARIRMATVNDTDYGDNDEAASNLIFSTTNGGTESDKMIITGRGAIGIGTNNPGNYKLNIAGGNADQLLIENTTSSGTANIAFKANSTRNSGPFIKATARGASADDSDLQLGDETGTVMTINGGRVGVGTVSPATTLDVSGSIRSEGPDGGLVMRYWNSGTTYGMIGTANMGSNEYSLLTNGQNTYIGAGSGGNTIIRSNANDPSVQLTFYGTGDVAYFEGGNVGIGTTSPEALLHIKGDTAPSIKIEAVDTSSPAMTAHMTIQGYDGRGKGIFLTESGSLAGREIFFGSTYSGNNANFSIGYNGDGNGRSEYIVSSSFYFDVVNKRLGIDNTAPQSKLHVGGGDVLISNNQFYLAQNTGSTKYKLAGITSGNVIQVGAIDYTTAGTIFAGGDSVRVTTGGAAGSTRIYVSGSGNVGIGTTSPAQKLHVNGNVEVDGNIYVNEYIFHNSDTNTNIRMQGDQINFDAGGIEFLRFIEDDTQDQFIVNEGSADIDFRVEGDTDTNLIRTDAANNRVGIGTGSPDVKLHILNSSEETIRLEGSNNTTAIHFWSGSNRTGILGHSNGTSIATAADPGDMVLRSESGKKVHIATNGANARMTVTAGGSVGINNTTPSYRLDITNTGTEAANMAIRNTGNGDAAIWFDGSNGDLQGSDYAYLGQKNSLVFEMRTAPSAGNIYLNPKDGAGAVDINGDLTVSGIVTAQEFHTEFVSASIIYQSGSTQFGDTSDDTHTFVGDLNVDGDIYIDNSHALNFSGSNNTNLIEINGSTLIKQISDRGGIQIGRDDAMVIGAGESSGIIAGQINTVAEQVHIGGESGVFLYGLPNNGDWAARTTLNVHENGYVALLTGSATRARIHTDGDSFFNGGNVGIRTSTPANTLQVTHFGQDGNNGIVIVRGDSTTVANDLLGSIGFDSLDGNIPSSNLEASAYIAAYASEDHSTGDKGGYLTFGTAPNDQDDDTVSLERMRILSNGNVGIGTIVPTQALTVEGNISGSGRLYLGTVDSNTTSTAALVLNGSEVEQRSLGNAAFQDTGSMTVSSADSVNGIQTTSFLRSDTSDTFTNGTLSFSAGTNFDGSQANTTDSYSIASKFLANPASEAGEWADVRILNNLAGAHKWATITLTDCYQSDRTTAVTSLSANAFDGTSANHQLYQNAAGDPMVIQIDLPFTISWSAWVGIVFGNPAWRAKSVKIETFRNGAWQTECNLTNQSSHIVARQVANNNSNGVTKIRYTLDDLQNTTSYYIRIVSLFNLNYATGAYSYGGVHYIDKYKDSVHYGHLRPATDSTYDLGSTSLYYRAMYSDKIYLNALDTNTTSTTALVLNGSEVEKRTLATGAFTTVGNSATQNTGSMTVLSADSADSATTAGSATTAVTASYASSVNYADIIGTPTLDNYGEWHMAGDADSTDITSGKWVKFVGGASITGTGTEANPYLMEISPSSASYATYAATAGNASTATSATSATSASHATTVQVTSNPASNNYDVVFTNGVDILTDTGGTFAYDNNTQTLTATNFSGLASNASSASHAEYADDAGLATNARFVDVNPVTTGTEYRVVFADGSGTSYEQMNVHDNGIEYDPGTGTLRVSGDIVAYNSFSDRELKDNIQTYQGGLNAVMQLNPVTYEWKKGREGQEIGLIAQEVEEVVPQVVREQRRMDEGTYKTVDYEKLVAVLIDAVQDQQKQIDELKQKLDGLTK